jgi:hypothetical protein
MALVLNDRVKETTTTTGTGALTFAGAVSGFETFSAGIGNSNTTYYAVAHQSANEWEVGLGTLAADSSTITRTTVFSSSNSDSAVDFAAGTKDIFCTYPAGKAVFKDASDNTNFADSEKIVFGTGADFEILHNSSTGNLLNLTTNPLEIHQAASNSVLQLINDSGSHNQVLQIFDGSTQHGSISTDTGKLKIDGIGVLELSDDGSTKLATTATGVQTTGTVNINGEYAFPTADGNANQILETDGSGALTFVDKPASGASAGFVIAMSVAL